ncbi:hypothetical protein [Kitasatospora sp. MAP5-34]|uniref:hypothetical protein n=1 Tax=Kitasatospora sp. MAP5-34 TaxID=3035102 RepID=UPI0024737329|nr:hypothetical protein [Kitasatospora sp. MAP5-34]MDH6577966.1 hypothetical protein [Kitasatospora sp. MAP5-34]
MPVLQRAVVLRAAAAVLALTAAVGAEAAVGHALARRGAERAEREAYVCGEVARLATAERAGRSQSDGRPELTTVRVRRHCLPGDR